MAFRLENFVQTIRDMIREELDKRRSLDFYIVTGVDEATFTVNIRSINKKQLSYDNVPIMSVGLGHLKAGIMNLPEIDDIVIAAFLDDTPTPMVLGNAFDNFSQTPDTLPGIKKGELLMTNQKAGAIVFLNSANEIILSSPDKGTKIKIKTGEVEITSTATVTVNATTVDVNASTVDVAASTIQMATGLNGFARVGDTITGTDSLGGTVSGTITSGSLIVKGGD